MASTADTNFRDDFADGRDLEENSSSFGEQLDLQHYLRILRKYKWPITLFTAAVTALAGYYAFTATPIYKATSTLLIEQQRANVPTIEELYGVDTQNTDYYQTQFELLKSRTLAEKVVDSLNLWGNPELSAAAREAEARRNAAQRDVLGEDAASGSDGIAGKVTGLLADLGLSSQPTTAQSDSSQTDLTSATSIAAQSADGEGSTDNSALQVGFSAEANSERQRIVSNFMARVTVAPVRKTKLVKLSYESDDPELAARVANAMGEQYINSYLEGKLEQTNAASSFLNDRLATLKSTLDNSKSRLISFKENNGLVDVDGSVNRLNEQRLLLDTTELATANNDLSSARDIYQAVQALRNQPDLLETVPGVQSDPLVQRTQIEMGSAQRALDELLNRYGERHPRVVDAKSQVSTLQAELQGHVSRVVNSIEKNFQLARQRVASIEGKLAAGKQSIQALGSKKFELDALDREVATNQEIYDKFFNTISEAKSADGLETANARISDYAIEPVSPIKPKKQLIIALAALASLVLSMLMAFLYEQMDDTVKSSHDVEGKLGMNLLGILPLIKGGVFNRTQDLPLNPAQIADRKGTFVESVNTARTALCMGEGDNPRKVIMVTSSVPGEGKSTTSINLAYSLAQLERVLLIDCDMRRPTIAKAAGFDKNVPGLSSLITNTAPARECIKRGVFDGALDILPSGPIPDQPLELISSKRFEKIVAQLSEHYDRIVIDSAPTQAVSDALVLSKSCDAVVYAVKSHDTSIDLVRRGIQRLNQINAPIAGIVITQVDIDKIISYGGDYYYQGYYDYYGYTDKGKKVKRPGKLRLSQEELINIKNDDGDVNLDLDYVSNDAAAMSLHDDGHDIFATSDLSEQGSNGHYQGHYNNEQVRNGQFQNGSLNGARQNAHSTNGYREDALPQQPVNADHGRVPVQPAQQQAQAANSDYDRIPAQRQQRAVDQSAEFDRTARFAAEPVAPTERVKSQRGALERKKKRFQDDLDII